MDRAEFDAHIDTLPPGMRFMVRHVVQLSVGVFVLFAALLVAVLVTGVNESGVIAVFCGVAMAMAVGNLTVFTAARRRLMRSGTTDVDL